MFLEIENLSVDLGEFKLKNINLSVNEGEYLILIGPTGSGKSVLLETIIGFYKPKNGIIKLSGEIINNLLPEDRNIGIVYQDHVLFPNMTVYENIVYGIKNNKNFSKEDIDRKIEKIAKTMHIDHILQRDVMTLSGGESQRTALARALIVEPKIILMDEPFSAVDITTQETLTSLIKHIGREYKTTFIHVTHNFNDIWNLADKVGVMKAGEIHQLGYVNDVFSKPENDFVAKFVGVQNIFSGHISETDANCVKIKINDKVSVYSSDKSNSDNICEYHDFEKVLIAIRPENIIFSNESFESSARNRLKGIVVNTVESGPITWVHTEVEGILFKGVLTKNSFESLNIKKGKEIYLIFKSLNVKVLDSYGSFNIS